MPALWPGQNGPSIDYISSPPSGKRGGGRRLTILGSTGSIGTSALSVVESNPERFEVIGLAGGRNMTLLARQALTFRPRFLAVLDEERARELNGLLPRGHGAEILTGAGGYAALASLPEADMVVSAQVGAAGLPATLAAALAGKTIALANKESLVIAGDLLREICRATGASILPLDSEHFAIFQCLAGRGQSVSRLILTASGGPFREYSAEALKNAGIEDALKHPNWKMGRKISVDSATMMNKSLEVIEACHLFGVPPDRVDVIVHPQSIVHSMIIFNDNSMLAQLAAPDMRGPIAACLFWPEVPAAFLPAPDLTALGQLTFEKADLDRFPALGLSRRALKGSAPGRLNSFCVVMNSANEKAVELFLSGRCRFDEIFSHVDAAISALAGALPEEPPNWRGLGGDIPKITGSIWSIMQKLDSAGRDFVEARSQGYHSDHKI